MMELLLNVYQFPLSELLFFGKPGNCVYPKHNASQSMNSLLLRSYKHLKFLWANWVFFFTRLYRLWACTVC